MTSNIAAMARAMMAATSTRDIAFEPEPMTIGIGPMNMIMPVLAELFERMEARRTMAIPSTATAIPPMSNSQNARVVRGSDSSDAPTCPTSPQHEIED